VVIPHFGVGHLRVTHPFATLTPRRIQGIPFDLHVLGTPPAFILSQDQTLRKFTFMVFETQSACMPSYHSSVVKVLPYSPLGVPVYHARFLLSSRELTLAFATLPVPQLTCRLPGDNKSAVYHTAFCLSNPPPAVASGTPLVRPYCLSALLLERRHWGGSLSHSPAFVKSQTLYGLETKQPADSILQSAGPTPAYLFSGRVLLKVLKSGSIIPRYKMLVKPWVSQCQKSIAPLRS
jgi:hypothetical protein